MRKQTQGLGFVGVVCLAVASSEKQAIQERSDPFINNLNKVKSHGSPQLFYNPDQQLAFLVALVRKQTTLLKNLFASAVDSHRQKQNNTKRN
jgi:hypothetical protein